jgi:hypothetical protein
MQWQTGPGGSLLMTAQAAAYALRRLQDDSGTVAMGAAAETRCEAGARSDLVNWLRAGTSP